MKLNLKSLYLFVFLLCGVSAFGQATVTFTGQLNGPVTIEQGGTGVTTLAALQALVGGGGTGPQGPPGPVGPQGPTGLTGPQGPAGMQGTPGTNGAAGPTGPAGAAGAKGATGATGATGPAGAKGSTGTTGAQGPAGATGPQGPAGASVGPINGTWIQFPGQTFSALNTAAPCPSFPGSIAYITDSTSTTPGTTAAGGGILPAFLVCKGAAWLVLF